jgi:hypothetical protein
LEKLVPVFSLWPNALKALASLGIDGTVRQLGIEEGSGGIRSWRGRLLFQLDLQELRRKLGGQGACQALEDAAVLTHCFENTNDPVAALRNYQSRRIRRANGFVRASRIVGRMFQLEGDLACRARDRLLESALYRRLQLNGLRRLADFTP